jgi:glyoxylase I family protein
VSLGAISNLDYTILLCNRMDETKAFYRDVMKFPIETDFANWVSFRVGAALLTLRPRGWSPFDDGKSVPGSAAIQLAFSVAPPAVDACHAELVAKGVPILRGPTDLPDWRHRTLFFRDPEDNIIENLRGILTRE